MKSFVDDIRLDSIDLMRDINFKTVLEKRIDSLFDLFSTDRERRLYNDIYFICRRTTRSSDFYYHDGTIQQLKNSGGLRLVQNRQISNDFISYDGEVRRVQSQYRLESEIRQNIRNLIGKLFNVFVIEKMEVYNGDSLTLIKPGNNPSLFSNDPGLINELLTQEQYLQSVYIVTTSLEKKLIGSGNRLIELIKRDYHLK